MSNAYRLSWHDSFITHGARDRSCVLNDWEALNNQRFASYLKGACRVFLEKLDAYAAPLHQMTPQEEHELRLMFDEFMKLKKRLQ